VDVESAFFLLLKLLEIFKDIVSGADLTKHLVVLVPILFGGNKQLWNIHEQLIIIK
jgi:hypothetical protein